MRSSGSCQTDSLRQGGGLGGIGACRGFTCQCCVGSKPHSPEPRQCSGAMGIRGYDTKQIQGTCRCTWLAAPASPMELKAFQAYAVPPGWPRMPLLWSYLGAEQPGQRQAFDEVLECGSSGCWICRYVILVKLEYDSRSICCTWLQQASRRLAQMNTGSCEISVRYGDLSQRCFAWAFWEPQAFHSLSSFVV